MPDQTVVVNRILCLGALVMRANLEAGLKGAASSPNETLLASAKVCESLDRWMMANDLKRHTSPKETLLLEKPFGSWNAPKPGLRTYLLTASN